MNKIRKIISMILVLTFIITGVNVTETKASVLGSGTLNKDGTIKWSLSSEGILTISGSGEPDNYTSAAEVPWDTLRDSIRKVQINTDTTGITNMAYWFKDCINLTYINRFPENTISLRSTFAGCTSLEEVPIIPMCVKQMMSTFNGCISLRKIPDFEILGVSNMSYTFKGCESLEYAFVSLSYPVTTVRGMFYGCSRLNAMIIFNGCIQLKKENCADMFTDAALEEGRCINVFAADMSMDTVKSLINTEYDKLNYCGVIDTNSGLNYNYDNKSDCSYAYTGSNNTLYVMGNGELNCSKIMGKFINADKVKTLNIGYGISDISGNAFKNYISLETVIMSDTLKNIGSSAFSGCSALKSIALTENIVSIGGSAFKGCKSLETVYIPDEVKSIGKECFGDMNKDFYLECSSENKLVRKFAEENNIMCRYPKCLSVIYKGNVVEGCRLDSGNFESIGLEYSDGTRTEIPYEAITIDDYKIEAGENILVAHYGDYCCTFQVTGTERTIIGIEALYDTEYDFSAVEGGNIDTNAISVQAEYDNGTKQYLKYGGITGGEGNISSSGYYTIDPYELVISPDGDLNEITIRARITDSSEISKTVKLNVPAVRKSITGISAVYYGGNIVEGTGLNTDNIFAYANFNNGTKERILFSGNYNKYGINTDTDYIVLDETVEHEDEFMVSQDYEYSIDAYSIKNSMNKITLWCNNKKTSFDVMGIPKSNTGISAVYNGTAVEDGELDMDKLDVSITYNNGDKELISDKNSVSFQDNYSIVEGDNYIDVIYIDNSTGKKYRSTVYVKGNKKTPVKIMSIVPMTDIIAGEWLKNIEFNVSIQYDNGKIYDSITSWDLKGCAVEGENHIYVIYKGLEGESVFQAGTFIPEIVTTMGTKPPEQLEKDNSVMVMVKSNSDSAMENKEIGWSSSDNSIVKVSDTGMVTAVNYGTAQITATVNGMQAIYNVEVPMPDITGIKAEYEGNILEDTDIDKEKLKVYFILENQDVVKLDDNSDVYFQKDYSIKEGENEIELYYIDNDTAQKYTCILEVYGIEKKPVEMVSVKALRNDIIAGEALRTLEFKAQILYDNGKMYDEIIKYEGKGFAEEGTNYIIVAYKGIRGEAEFEVGKFVPQIVLKSGESVPEKVLQGQNQELTVISNCDAAMENKTILWRSSDENVMTVDDDGKVTILKPGTSDITAKVNGESVKCTIRVIVPAKDLKIPVKNMTISKGKSVSLKFSIQPENSTDIISWVSSNTDIATVSDKGKIKAVNIGKCVITAVTESGISKRVNLTVKKEAGKISLNKSKVYLVKGKTLKLEYKLPSDTFTSKVTWSSSNKKVAAVSSTGKITAKKVGSAVITVKTASGKKSVCKIYVRNNPSSIVLNKKSVTLKKGKSLKLKYKIPLNSYAGNIIWTSGNKKVVTVSSSGKIKALKKGVTYIKVKTNNNKTAKCKIKVV